MGRVSSRMIAGIGKPGSLPKTAAELANTKRGRLPAARRASSRARGVQVRSEAEVEIGFAFRRHRCCQVKDNIELLFGKNRALVDQTADQHLHPWILYQAGYRLHLVCQYQQAWRAAHQLRSL